MEETASAIVHIMRKIHQSTRHAGHLHPICTALSGQEQQSLHKYESHQVANKLTHGISYAIGGTYLGTYPSYDYRGGGDEAVHRRTGSVHDL